MTSKVCFQKQNNTAVWDETSSRELCEDYRTDTPIETGQDLNTKAQENSYLSMAKTLFTTALSEQFTRSVPTLKTLRYDISEFCVP